MEEEDEVFEKARNMLTDSDNSQSPPANWINKLRHRSSKIGLILIYNCATSYVSRSVSRLLGPSVSVSEKL